MKVKRVELKIIFWCSGNWNKNRNVYIFRAKKDEKEQEKKLKKV